MTGYLEYDELFANLTATQERCNTLLEEAHTARRELEVCRAANAALATQLLITNEALESVVATLELLTAEESPAN